MLSKLLAFMRRYDMVQPGDRVVCAVSGGADSMALLWAMYLLRQKLDLELYAAHFNHGLRGEESERDEAFVRDFCQGYGIGFFCESAQVKAGKKGLEAAAREARYAFLNRLPGKIATAHTANDNAETVLMHMVRGTGLKGLGGITPCTDKLIRPMLTVTRQEVLSFLESYSIPYVQDSSNDTDRFLRNRLRRNVMPLLQRENPRLAENLSEMALALRQDEQALSCELAGTAIDVSAVRELPEAKRKRMLSVFLQNCGVKEPQREHIHLAESLVFSDNPSASGNFPGGVRIRRNYGLLEKGRETPHIAQAAFCCPGSVRWQHWQIHCKRAENNGVCPVGQVVVRCRQAGDSIRLSGGTKSLKKLYIDRKIPEKDRVFIPVIADEQGVLWVGGIGPNLDRLGTDGYVFEITKI